MAEILRYAEDVLEEYGYDQAAVGEVARRAGVVEGTVYHYFETKRDLYISVAEMWYKRVLDANRPELSHTSLYKRLREMVRAELVIIRESPAVVRFILMELRPDPAFREMNIFAMNRKLTASLTRVLKDGIARGELVDHIPLRTVRDMIFGGIEHQTWAFLRDEGDFSVEDAADAISYVIYNGLKRRPPPANEHTPSLNERVETLERIVGSLKSSDNA